MPWQAASRADWQRGPPQAGGSAFVAPAPDFFCPPAMAEPWLQALSGSEDALAAALVAACEEQSELSELVAHAAEQAQ